MVVDLGQVERNWAGNYSYGAGAIHAPNTVEELRSRVAGATRIRALGSRHSFNALADSSGVLVSLSSLATEIAIDGPELSVTVSAGTKYGVLAAELARQGFALHNLASLPHISLAGAIATGTHGSGDGNGNLATAVLALDFVDANGEIRHVSRAHTPDFAGYVVGLGALGILTRVTLRIEPSFTVAQHVYTGLPWDAVLSHFDEVTADAYSVSMFTDWRGDRLGQLWFKQRMGDGRRGGFPPSYRGGAAAVTGLHPLPGVSAANCTLQLGVPGSWSERLAHFRMDFTPSSGDEIQSEYLLPREHAVAAIMALRAMSPVISPLLQVSEIRTIAADDLWLSPSYGRESIGLHFTWVLDQPAVDAVLPLVEEALAPFQARPHWGKAFAMDAVDLAALYPKFDAFKALTEIVDPAGKFRNDFLARKVFG